MSLLKSIVTVSGFTMLSRIVGFIRDVLIANFLGATILSDAFFVALKFPNLFRRFFAEGAFNAAFVPIYSGTLESENKEEAKNFANEAFSALFYLLLLFVVFMEITMPYMIYLLAPGFVGIEGKLELAVELSRITFPFLLFISIVSMQSGILNSFGKFAAAAGTPIILNVCLIASLFVLNPFTKTPAHALSIAVTLAGVIQFLWLRYNLTKQGAHLKLLFKVEFSEKVRLLLKRTIPGLLGAGIYQINLMVDTILVSFVANGAVSWLYYSNRLNQLPLGVIGAAVGTALLPLLSKQLKAKDEKSAIESQNRALEFAMLITLPATMALIIIAEPIVSVLFEHGAFGRKETIATALALSAFSFGLPAYVLVKVLSPNFFARGDTVTPVKIAIISLVLNIILNIVLMFPFGHVGIASATSISAWVSCFIYIAILRKKGLLVLDKQLKRRFRGIFLATLTMSLYLFFFNEIVELFVENWLSQPNHLKIIIFSFLVLSGGTVFFISGLIFKAGTINGIKKLIKGR